MNPTLLLLVLACGTSAPTPPTAPAAPVGTMPEVVGPDADGDGLSDADEATRGTDPADPDSDDDGKRDGEEVYVWHTDPLALDSDGDGVGDGAELARGSDPNDASDRPTEGGVTPPEPGAAPVDEVDAATVAPATMTPDCRFDKQDLETCMVTIPGGAFLMGAQASDPTGPGHDPAALDDEGPPHLVEVSSFRIMRDEVLVSTFAACVEGGACREDDVATGGLSTWGPGSASRSGLPITSIDWEGAQRLCTFLGGRLPTEAEWEFAARGPEARRFPWGAEPGCGTLVVAGFNPDGTRKGDDEMATGPCEHEGPSAVRGLAGESPFRLRGMAGNVWEWVADAYEATAYAHPDRPPTGAQRAQRGGGWTSRDPLELRSAARMSMPPTDKVVDVGVRCASDLPTTATDPGAADAP